MTVSVPADVFGKVVDFVGLSSATTKRASDELAVHRAGREKAAALVGPLVQDLVQKRVIEKSAAPSVEAMLGSHDTTLQLLKEAAEMIAELRQTAPVEPGKPEKRASDRPTIKPGRQGSAADEVLQEFLS